MLSAQIHTFTIRWSIWTNWGLAQTLEIYNSAVSCHNNRPASLFHKLSDFFTIPFITKLLILFTIHVRLLMYGSTGPEDLHRQSSIATEGFKPTWPSLYARWARAQQQAQSNTNINLCPYTLTSGKSRRRSGQLTWSRPSSVLGIVTHFVGCAPLVVTAVMRLSSSSRFSFSFLTRLSMARFEKDSLSPPWRWHMRLCTMLRQASAEVGVCEVIILVTHDQRHRLFG